MLPVPSYTQQYMRCPNCGSQVTANSNYCNFCGTALSPTQFCSKFAPDAARKFLPNRKFCPECGKKQPAETSPQKPTEQTQAADSFRRLSLQAKFGAASPFCCGRRALANRASHPRCVSSVITVQPEAVFWISHA